MSENNEKKGLGLFGKGEKQERNLKSTMMFYILAACYLTYTAFDMGKQAITGTATGNLRIFYGIFTVVFAVAVVWILWAVNKMWKQIKAEEAEQERREAEEAGNEYVPKASMRERAKAFKEYADEEEKKRTSVAAHAAAFVNKADEDEEEAVENTEE